MYYESQIYDVLHAVKSNLARRYMAPIICRVSNCRLTELWKRATSILFNIRTRRKGARGWKRERGNLHFMM